MKYINKFDFIVENVAQARSILAKNKINYDNPVYQEILKATKRDGYTGIITRLVFELNLDLGSALNVYEVMKKNNVDVSDPKLKEIIESKDHWTKKVTNIINFARKEKEKDYEYLFTSWMYKVYKINTYEGIMKTGSPAWCLKTKSYFDSYTKVKKGTQFVVIHENFVPNESILLTTPDKWDGIRYESGSYAKMRFGVTVYQNGNMDIFDDSNISINFYNKTISNDKYSFIVYILDEILAYYSKNIKPLIPTTKVNSDDYDDMKELIVNTFEELGMDNSFSALAQESHRSNLDDEFAEFYDKIQEETGLSKIEFLRSLNGFREQILGDYDFIQHDGYMDILVNEFLTYNAVGGEIITLPDIPNITAREHPLGGSFFDENETGDLVIKYSYGYQYTKYGRAGIEQGFGNLRNFYKEISDYFVNLLVDDNYVNFDIFDLKTIPDLDTFKKSLETCIVREVYQDGYNVVIDLTELMKILKKSEIGYSTYDLEKHKYIKHPYENVKQLKDKIKNSVKGYFSVVTYEKDSGSIIIPVYTL